MATPALTVTAKVDAARTEAAFKAARREINAQVRDGLRRAAQTAVLPRVKILAPSVVRENLVARATSRRAYITVAGPREKDRIAGLLNYGGIVRTPIRPKKGRAISFAPGGGPRIARAGVNTPRHYTGKHFIEAGVTASVGRIEDVMLAQILDAFDGFQTSI